MSKRRPIVALVSPRRLGLELSLGRLVPSAGAGLGASAAGIGLLATSGFLITRASERPPVFALAIAIGAVQAFALARGVARYFERLGVHSVALFLLGRLRLRLYDALEPLVPAGLEKEGSGSVTAALVADTEIVTEALAKQLTAAIDLTASTAFGVLVALLVEPQLALVLLGGTLLVVLLTLVLVGFGHPGTKLEAEGRQELADAVVDTFQAAPELVAYGREDLLLEHLASLRRHSMRAAWRRGLAVGSARAAVTLVAGGGLLGVVGLGLSENRAGRLSGVMLAVVALVALALFDQLSGLAPALGEVDAGQVAAERLGRLAKLAPPAVEPLAGKSPPPGPVAARLSRAVVSLRGDEILHGVSLEATPARRLGLLGPNGAGKTTVLHALLHFVSCERGEARVGGVDVSSMKRGTIARHVNWMAEETHVFSASLADNLRLARPAADDETLCRVLARVGLDGWYEALPGGLSTMLGAGGRPLSAGERQRLGLARLLLGEGGLLLLDEPTAHLDARSSAKTLSEVLEAAGERSVILISHEPGIAGQVDQVVSMDKGRVAASRPGSRASGGGLHEE